MSGTLRIFVDSNVLFSASRVTDHSFLPFWTHRNARAVISTYVVKETESHIVREDHRRRFDELLGRTEIGENEAVEIPIEIDLPAKDRPILVHAIAARARYLARATGSILGRYFDQVLDWGRGPLTIVSPSTLLNILDAAK